MPLFFLCFQHDEATALCARIRFYRSFLSSLLSLWKGEVAEGQRHLVMAADNIKVVEDTVAMGEEPEDGKDMMGETR